MAQNNNRNREIMGLLRQRFRSIVTANRRAVSRNRHRMTTARSNFRRPGTPGFVPPPPPDQATVPMIMQTKAAPNYATPGVKDTAFGAASVPSPAPKSEEVAIFQDELSKPLFQLPSEQRPYISFLTANLDKGRFDGKLSANDRGFIAAPPNSKATVPMPTYDPNLIRSQGNNSPRRRSFIFKIDNPRVFWLGLVASVLAIIGLITGMVYLSRYVQPTQPQKFAVAFTRIGQGNEYAPMPDSTTIAKNLSDEYLAHSGVGGAEGRVSQELVKKPEQASSEIDLIDSDILVWGYQDPNSKTLNLNLTLKPNGPFDPPDGAGYKEIQRRLYDPNLVAFIVPPPASKTAANYPLTTLISGLYHYYSGGYEQAVANFTSLTRSADTVNLPAMRLLRGNALYAFGKYNEAVDEYDKLLTLISEASQRGVQPPIDPAYVLNNRGVAVSFLPNRYSEALNNLDEAMKRLNTLSRPRVNYVAVQLDRPGTNFSSQQLADNMKILESAAKQEPGLSSTYYYMGRIYNLQRNSDKAIENYKKTIELDPNQPGNYRELGWIYLKANKESQVESARTQFQTGLDLAQRQAQESRDQAAGLLSQNQTELARVWQNRGQALENVQNDLKYGLARVAYERGWREGNKIGNPFDKVVRWAQGQKTGLEEARDRLLDVIANRPNFAEPYLYLGQTFELLGEGDSNAQYAKARQLEKDNPAALLNFTQAMATFRVRQGRPNDAINEYNDYLKRFPSNFQAHADLAKLYADLGQFDKGLNEAQVAFRNSNGVDNQSLAEAYLSAGRAQLGLKRNNEALTSFDQALKIKADYAAAHYQRGNALFALNRFDEARVAYNAALTADNPNSPETHYRLGLIYMDKLNDSKSAREQFELAVKDQPKLPDAHFRLGQLYSRDNATLDKAISAYSEAIKYNDRNAAAFYLRGLLYEIKARAPEAEADYRHALELEPGLVNARDHLARVMVQSGRMGDALKEAQTAARQEPSNADFQNTLGDIYRYSADYNRAITSYSEAIRLKANFPAAFYGRALSYYRTEKYGVGIVDIDQTVKLDPKYPGALVLQAQYYSQNNKLDEAIKILEQARQLNPNDAELYTSFGIIYLRRNQADLSIENFNRAIQLDPNQVDAYFWLGSLYNGRNERDQAIAAYEKTVQLRPEWALAWRYLGEQYAAKGDLDKAIQKFDTAVQKDSKQIEAFYQRGNAYHSKNQRAKAQDDYDAALALNSKYAPAQLQKAILYEEVGDTSKARQYYKLAFDNATTDQQIKAEAQRSLTRIGP